MRTEKEKSILVVDDDPPILKAVKFILEDEGYRVLTAQSAEEALEIVNSRPGLNLVISDVIMPIMDGFNFCRKVRSIEGNELLPFIFLTGEKSVASRVNGLRSGANAYLVKPFIPEELLALVGANLARHQAYEEQVMRDPLTGIANRRALNRVLEIEMARARRYQRSLAVAMLDLDHFKELNDTKGHLAGDRALVGVTEVFLSQLRQQDTVGRYGGEEFLVILPETNMVRAHKLLERLRGEVDGSTWSVSGKGQIHITVSIGVTELRKDDSPKDLISRADNALYQAKTAGRNCVKEG